MKHFIHKKKNIPSFDIIHLSGPRSNYTITENGGTLFYTGKDTKNMYEITEIEKFYWAKGDRLESTWTIEYADFASSLNKLDIFKDGSCKAAYIFDGDVTELSGLYPSTAATNTYASGKFGQAASVNGNQYVYIGEYDWSMIQSISIWFKNSSTSGYRTILGSKNNGSDTNTDNMILGVYNGNLMYYNTGSITLKSGLTSNVWHHVVINKLATNRFDFYLNNVKVGSNKTITDASLDLKYFGSDNVGSGIGANEAFIGQIDQVRMFTRPLNISEINTLYTEK